MKATELKELLIRSLDTNADPEESARKIMEAGVTYDFRSGFSERVLDKVYASGSVVIREVEFVRSLNFAFKRIAITGVAAIILLLISIFLMEGSLSFNTFLGLSDSYDEGIICLLTGN